VYKRDHRGHIVCIFSHTILGRLEHLFLAVREISGCKRKRAAEKLLNEDLKIIECLVNNTDGTHGRRAMVHSIIINNNHLE
jgi:hypothetical protein